MKLGYLSEIFVSFQGEGAHVGERHLFLRLAGCNIRCAYCDTPDSLERSDGFVVYGPDGQISRHANPISSTALRTLLKTVLAEQPPIDALAVTGGEPLVQAEFLAEVLEGRPLPVPVLLETSGVLPQRLQQVRRLIDIISMDIKLPSNTGERGFWKEHADFLATAHGTEVYAKILVDDTTTGDDLERTAQLLADNGAGVAAFLQPITLPNGRTAISAERLDTLYRSLRSRHPNVRVLPQTHKMMDVR